MIKITKKEQSQYIRDICELFIYKKIKCVLNRHSREEELH